MTTMLQTTETSQSQLVPFSSIHLNEGSQSRVRVRPNIVNDYAAAMKLQLEEDAWRFPPVILFQEDDVYWIGDGFHRVFAAMKLNLTEIAAQVRIGTQRDALLHSISANTDHGLPRTNADKRRAVQILLNDPEWKQWSDREIGRRCQVVHGLVSKLRTNLSGFGSLSSYTFLLDLALARRSCP